MAKAKKILAFLAIPLIFVWYCTAQEISAEHARRLRAQIALCSKQYIGCPYQTGAIGPEAFDCSGLVYTVMREAAEIQMPRSVRAVYSKAKTIPLSQIEEGDLVFFKTTGDGSISHVGIYIGRNQFIHAASDGANNGVIVSSLKERYYANCFASAGRVLPSGRGSNEIYVDDTEKSEESEKPSVTAGRTVEAKASPKNSNVLFDATLFCDWNLWFPQGADFNWHGIALETNIRYAGWRLQPGLGAIFRYNHGTQNFQIPIVLSLTFKDYIKFYLGPLINCGIPKISTSGEKIKGWPFPGIIGISFQTPTIKIGKVEVSLVQDLDYTFYTKRDRSAISAKEHIGTGFVFSTGIRVTLPLSNFLK